MRPAQTDGGAGIRTPLTAVWVTAILAVTAACWILIVRQMAGMDTPAMDMGAATELGPFTVFIALWVTMMAAMMLPGAAPAALRNARAAGRVVAVPLFIASYLAVWALVGIATYALYRPHGNVAAGVLVILAGLYELTPVKQHFRGRCRDRVHSGFEFGLYCVGSSIGLTLLLIALGVMSIVWMAVIAVLGVAQKLLPARAVIDVPLALVIVGLGILTMVTHSSAAGPMPSM
jgi:predicted metal-binding membrane protein